MTGEEAAKRLVDKGIRPTANRILVYKMIVQKQSPLSLKNLEQLLLDLDKSSIFRVLSLFLEHDVVHAFEDGRGVLNYELCSDAGKCHKHDIHPHFYCESCQRSFCLEDQHIPHIDLPEGFTPHSVSFVIKGECNECKKKTK